MKEKERFLSEVNFRPSLKGVTNTNYSEGVLKCFFCLFVYHFFAFEAMSFFSPNVWLHSIQFWKEKKTLYTKETACAVDMLPQLTFSRGWYFKFSMTVPAHVVGSHMVSYVPLLLQLLKQSLARN